jgi:hypothetical protein
MKWLHGLGDMLLGYAGILMSSLAGVFGLLRDRFGSKFQGKVWQSLTMVGVFGGMLWALMAAQHDAREHRDEMESTLKKVNEFVTTQVAEGTHTVMVRLDSLEKRMLDQGVRPAVAKSVSLEQASDILKAGTAAQAQINSQPASSRKSLTIHYYDHFTKDVDFEKVKPLLDRLADQVEAFTPKVEAPTNSVWWGPGSSLDQAKIVALLVTGAGVQVMQICRSTKPHAGVDNLIQIGGSGMALRQHMKPLTTAEIQALTAPVCVQGGAVEQ